MYEYFTYYMFLNTSIPYVKIKITKISQQKGSIPQTPSPDNKRKLFDLNFIDVLKGIRIK